MREIIRSSNGEEREYSFEDGSTLIITRINFGNFFYRGINSKGEKIGNQISGMMLRTFKDALKIFYGEVLYGENSNMKIKEIDDFYSLNKEHY